MPNFASFIALRGYLFARKEAKEQRGAVKVV